MSKRRCSSVSSQSEGDMSDRHEDTRFTAATIMVDADGDLTMRLKGGKLKVSRKVLSISSPVFRAMLGAGSPFRESTDMEFERDGTQAVSLDDDDFQTMAMIARIMHLQSDKVPDKLTFKQLYQVAVLCDKYDLKRCLGYWPKIWATPYMDSYGIEGYEGWLFMSTVFGYDGLFREVTRHLILNSKVSRDNSLVTTKGIDLSERVSSTIIDRMMTARSEAMFLVLDTYWQECAKLRDSKQTRVCKIGGAHIAKCDAVNLGCLLQQFPNLDDPGRLPPSCDETVNSIVAGSDEILDVCGAFVFKFGDHRSCAVGPRMVARAKEVLWSIHGLELKSL